MCTLFIAVIAFVAPFIPVDIEVLAYKAYKSYRKENHQKLTSTSILQLCMVMGKVTCV